MNIDSLTPIQEYGLTLKDREWYVSVGKNLIEI